MKVIHFDATVGVRTGRRSGESKLYLLASIVGAALVSRAVHAAPPTEGECAATIKGAAELRGSGDLSGARARLGACLSPACPGQLRQECERQRSAISAAMPAVVLEAKDEASNNITAVRVTLDGTAVLERLDGTPLLVNPGTHRATFEAVGFRRTESTFVAPEPQKKLRVVVFLSAAPGAASSTAPGAVPAGLMVAPATSASASVRVPPATEATSFTKREILGLALGAAGIGGVAVGTIWSIRSKMTYDNAVASECGGDPGTCTQQGIANGQTAHRQATVATIGFLAAGALFAAGAAIYFTGPQQDGVALVPTADRGGGLAVVGKW